jgi:hypothetical protein
MHGRDGAVRLGCNGRGCTPIDLVAGVWCDVGIRIWSGGAGQQEYVAVGLINAFRGCLLAALAFAALPRASLVLSWQIWRTQGAPAAYMDTWLAS